MFPRLGYACINMVAEAPINRSCTQKTLKSKGLEYGASLARQNLANVVKILEWNARHDIHVYRLSSDMFPHATNSVFIQPGQNFAYDLQEFQDEFDAISRAAKKFDQRLTFHPGQYNQIGTPHSNVLASTTRDLLFHASILDAMDCDLNSVMVVHGGGVYGNKYQSLVRWVDQFYALPSSIQRRIVIENDERQYSIVDMIWLSERINRPIVFDTHHHDCYSKHSPLPPAEYFMDTIISTWTRLGLRPKFHVSEQDPHKRLGAHSKYILALPRYLFRNDIDVMLEAKAKEQAVLYLYSKYNDFNGKWVLF